MSRNKKLRLLVLTDCPHHCPLCCNRTYNIDDIQLVNRWNYQQIMITGGEPLLHPLRVIELINNIRAITRMQGTYPLIFLYTSVCDSRLEKVLPYLNGVVVTPHNVKDVREFLKTKDSLLHLNEAGQVSLRLNLFSNIEGMIPEGTDLSNWQIKRIEWVKDCPVPEGEDFRRIKNLW